MREPGELARRLLPAGCLAAAAWLLLASSLPAGRARLTASRPAPAGCGDALSAPAEAPPPPSEVRGDIPARSSSLGQAGDRIFIDLAQGHALNEADATALFRTLGKVPSGPKPAGGLTVDYPYPGSLFPPDMVAPTFVFHDAREAARLWLVEITVAGEPGRMLALTDGRRALREKDPRCGEAPGGFEETESQKSAGNWTPSPGLWADLAGHPDKDVTAVFFGLPDLRPDYKSPAALSRGSITFRVSADPVGAPVFYRDVPLMPTSNEQGVVMPLAEGALPLIEWRIRDLSRPSGTVVLRDMPTCANCHSFSLDGKVLGMDMDGPAGDKGSYAVAPVEPRMAIGRDKVFSWNAFHPKVPTFGMFSRVSPDGRFVVSSVDESVFVANYMDFRFLQTFYPTRGILAYYDTETKKIATLPGADDPAYVHTNAVWTPDGETLVFLRADAAPNRPSGRPPEKANDPNEVRIRYDLFTIPFNGGRGGEARPLPGASMNGRSNSFPKVSPDGRWIVWVRAGNGLLMRPDSELYIMPAAGGTPRRMTCNLRLMNSWHSWSPNSRWLVFASKANTPYTEMFLTHIDGDGNDSPAVLVPNSTAANRAVNLPEFVNIRPGGLVSIDAPAVDYRRHLVKAAEHMRAGRLEDAFAELKTADGMRPGFPDTLAAFGFYYRNKGDTARAIEFFEKALAIDPGHWPAHNFYGVTLFRLGRYEDALRHFQASIDANPFNFQALTNYGVVELTRGNLEEARAHFERALEASSRYPQAHFDLAMILAREGDYGGARDHYERGLELEPENTDGLISLAWLLATCPEAGVRNGARALELARRLGRQGPVSNPRAYDALAAAYAESGEFGPAAETAAKALEMTGAEDPSFAMRRRLLELYKSGRPYHRPPLPDRP